MDIAMNRQGLTKLGHFRSKEERTEKGKRLGDQVKDFLKEDLVKDLRNRNPNGWEILMAFLAYESSPPNIDRCTDDREYIIKAARKEGVRFIYETLEKLMKEIEDNGNNTGNRQ